jgi:hypothetical protein
MKQKIQLCVLCEQPTEQCEEDSLYSIGDEGPLCEPCFVDDCDQSDNKANKK